MKTEKLHRAPPLPPLPTQIVFLSATRGRIGTDYIPTMPVMPGLPFNPAVMLRFINGYAFSCGGWFGLN